MPRQLLPVTANATADHEPNQQWHCAEALPSARPAALHAALLHSSITLLQRGNSALMPPPAGNACTTRALPLCPHSPRNWKRSRQPAVTKLHCRCYCCSCCSGRVALASQPPSRCRAFARACVRAAAAQILLLLHSSQAPAPTPPPINRCAPLPPAPLPLLRRASSSSSAAPPAPSQTCHARFGCCTLSVCPHMPRVYFFSSEELLPESDEPELLLLLLLLLPDCCARVSPIFMEAVDSAWILALRSGRSSDCAIWVLTKV